MRKIILITLLFFLFCFEVQATPKVNILDFPPQTYSNQEFNVVFNVINDVISLDSYSIKGRIGSSSASLTKGLTFNPISSNWLSDTSSWDNFPQINFNNDFIATATVKLKTDQTILTGNNLLIVRVNKSSKNYDSSSSALLVLQPSPTETTTPIFTPTITSTEIPTPQSYDNIYLSEAMVNPETANHEWVEIYNNNDFDVSLTNWYIDDIENGGSSPKLFYLEIPSKNYRVFNLNSSMFNNDGDSVRLLDFNKNLKDSFEYSSSTQGKTWGRNSFDNDNFCLQEPSYELPNNSCINPTITPDPTPSKTLALSITSKDKSRPVPTKNLPKNSIIVKSNINYSTIVPTDNQQEGQILGISTKEPVNDFPLIRLLSFLSFSYSLLTIVAVLIRIKFIYGKVEKLLSTFIYTSGT